MAIDINEGVADFRFKNKWSLKNYLSIDNAHSQLTNAYIFV